MHHPDPSRSDSHPPAGESIAGPQRFAGFGPGKTHTTLVPNDFFSQLLPLIDDLAELKLTAYCFWALQQQEGDPRYITRGEVLADDVFLRGLHAEPAPAAALAEAALARATARGTLLHARIDGTTGPEDLYFLNTVRGRNAIQAIAAGRFEYRGRDCPIALADPRPNVFTLYEDNIGPLTPLISDELRDAEATYPVSWIEEATRLAVAHNKRNWRYILAILKRWQAEGKDDGRNRGSSQTDRYRHIQGELSDYIDY